MMPFALLQAHFRRALNIGGERKFFIFYLMFWFICLASSFADSGSSTSSEAWVTGLTAIIVCEPWVIIAGLLASIVIIDTLPDFTTLWIVFFGATNTVLFLTYFKFKWENL